MLTIRTNNPLKVKAIDKVSNMSNDKIKEFIDIIEILNADEIKAKDIRGIKFYALGYLTKKIEILERELN